MFLKELMSEEGKKKQTSEIYVVNKTFFFSFKSYSLGDFLAHIADRMASNTKAWKQVFRKYTAVAYEHMGGSGVHFLHSHLFIPARAC